MGISIEVNLFCLSIVLIFIIFLIIKYFQNIFSDSTAFWTRLGKNFNDKPVDDFLISVVYQCDKSLQMIIEQLKNIQILYEKNFQLDKKLEIIVISDARHDNYADIRLLNKVFPNLMLISADLTANESISPKHFITATLAARGEFIVDSKTFADEIDKLQQNPHNYISIYNNGNNYHFSVISKSSFEYMRRIHFINTIPIEEFMIIAKMRNIPYNILKNNKTKIQSIFSRLYTNCLVKLANFCYSNKIWKLPTEINKGEKRKKN